MLKQNNQVENLKSKIFDKKKESDLIDTYHYLMIHYGYIPFEEFKKMDFYLVNELIDRINKMNKEISKGNKVPRGRKW